MYIRLMPDCALTYLSTSFMGCELTLIVIRPAAEATAAKVSINNNANLLRIVRYF